MKFTKKIGGREFELEVYTIPGMASETLFADYVLRMRQPNQSVEFWGVLPETLMTRTWEQWAALVLRQIVATQKCELPRLQGYEVYLLNLWARELSTEVTLTS